MKKDSLVIFSLSALLSLGIVGGMYYFHLQWQQWPPDPAVVESPYRINTGQPKGNSRMPANHRTDTPIKCTKPDGSVFWTNAARCEGADLDNRLSYADPVKPVPRVRIDESHSKKSNGGSSGVSSHVRKTMNSIKL
jgi:hypothetical protein